MPYKNIPQMSFEVFLYGGALLAIGATFGCLLDMLMAHDDNIILHAEKIDELSSRLKKCDSSKDKLEK